MRVVAAGARDHRVLWDRLLDRLDQLHLLVIGERRRFTRGAGDDHAVRAVGDEHVRELLGALVVDRSVGFERRDHRGEETTDFSHDTFTNPISSACSAIWTAFSAAPLRMLSETIHSASPRGVDESLRIRPT